MTPRRTIRATPPGRERKWVSFEDADEDRTWMFDLSFLESRWCCIYAKGCQGVLTEPSPELMQGCCSYGAHMVDDADAERVEQAAASLSASEWQFFKHARTRPPRGKGTESRQPLVLKRLPSGTLATRLVDGACIFLNRPGFPGGAGCALHSAAVARGVHPMTMKPDVCWQLPLRREDHVGADGHVTSMVGSWERRHWGSGGKHFHWWCTEDARAFSGARPVYEDMAAELAELTSPWAYSTLLDHLRGKQRDGGAHSASGSS
jgi:hypothetical protein